MSMLEVSIKGLPIVQNFFQRFPQQSAIAQRDAINTVGRYAYAESSRLIRQQVNLTQNYLGSAAAGNRLKITQRATESRPVLRISANLRAVSLARFAGNRDVAASRRGKGVRITVKPGSSRTLRSAFLVKLRPGTQTIAEQFNLGLVVRVPKNGTINVANPRRYSRKDPNLFLLYGPSVDQIFRQVREDVEDGVVDRLTAEYLRQMGRQLG